MDGLRIQSMTGVLATAIKDSPAGAEAFAAWLDKGAEAHKPRTVTEARQLGEGVLRKLCPPGRLRSCPMVTTDDDAGDAQCEGCAHGNIMAATARLQARSRQ
jgi:hypothetical protein